MRYRASSYGMRLLLPFLAAIFTSAFLLFAIQPMFTKMVLPQLGGSPAVWSIAMVVFQSLLLAGYAYAHVLTTRLTPRTAAVVHVLLLAVTLLALPIAVTSQLGTPPAEGQAVWLIGVFLLSVGLPFFAVAGNGPLLQAWFSRSGHPHAADPYFLYGASNLGSFAALLLYPVAIEPLLSVRAQAESWSLGFGLLIVLIVASAAAIWGAPAVRAAGTAHASRALSPRPAATRIAAWVALAFIPSGLMVAVTAHISTDVAAAPFLWVMPLALFLLTFVLLFRDRPLMPMALIERVLPIFAAALVVFSVVGEGLFVVMLLVHVTFFFLATLVCHHQLYQLRPAADRLTDFYLWMSVGGVLGGLFCGLVAPQVFDRVLEYPVLVVVAVLALPEVWKAGRKLLLLQAGPVLALGALAIGALLVATDGGAREPADWVYGGFLGAACATLLLYRRPIMVAAALVVLFGMLDTLQRIRGGQTFERSFFGVHKIETMEEGQFRILSHGTTIHGAMRIAAPDGSPVTGQPMPLTYYHPQGPIAESLRAVPVRDGGRRVGVVGLGTGAHACNGETGDQWSFFEIDPTVIGIATDPSRFRFLSECAPAARLVLGDARLTLADEAPSSLDYLLVDAFSSDSIPVHLMTRQALALYMERLAPGGIVALHVSNRHMELESVLATLARELGLAARIKHFRPTLEESGLAKPFPTNVVVLARKAEDLGPLDAAAGWRALTDRNTDAWTDDFSNIVTAIWRRYTAEP
ncbi:spermidine synthase [Pannonibacter tanglangensis]|uniref:Spermidine synthase n=1 Tax=Pannonibacter tanglangensis TaxID=2750084 RepID=A0ABW9ZHC0_9HYPH|nr:fused MFS/spermidine synthase [Pannonibacter sp. XCT-34]NBN62549.1 hypothetical protein [Pannonibacter sp. XCT-34]